MKYEQLTLDSFIQESKSFGNRKDLLDTMTLYGASLYLASCVSEMDRDKLTDADYWYEYLGVEEGGESH